MVTGFDNETTAIAVAVSLNSSAAVMGWAWADSHGDSDGGTMTGKTPKDALRTAILDALPKHPAGRLDIVTTNAPLRRSLASALHGDPAEDADRGIAQQAAARPAAVTFRAPDEQDDAIRHTAQQIATEQKKARMSQGPQPPADTPHLLREAEDNLRATADALRALAHEQPTDDSMGDLTDKAEDCETAADHLAALTRPDTTVAHVPNQPTAMP